LARRPIAAPDSERTTIRVSLSLLAGALAPLALPAVAHAQSSHGSIAVAATILPAAPAATVFVRVPADSGTSVEQRYVVQSRVREAELLRRRPAATRDSTVRLERLILAGT